MLESELLKEPNNDIALDIGDSLSVYKFEKSKESRKALASKAKAYKDLATRSNVYQGIYLLSLIQEYRTAYNISVLQGENKYK